jgi:AcrR family transcriptional regulator
MSSTSGRRGAQRRPRRDALVNRDKILTAATAAYRSEGPLAPMSDIAAQAGVGVGTLYRRYASREALLDALTERSFDLVSRCAIAGASAEGPALAGVAKFLQGVMDCRDELVLPLHGGPTHLSAVAAAARSKVHRELQLLLDRGIRDGSIRSDATVMDVVIFAAMLAQPLPSITEWALVAARLKTVYLDGLGTRP